MSEKTQHRVHSDELCAALERVLERRVITLRRRRSRYASSYAIENLEVVLVAGGTPLRLVFKDSNPAAAHPAAHNIRPVFIHHPAREIEVYRKILNPAQHGTPHYHGAVNEPEKGRHWLFLERVRGPLLWQVGDLKHWENAARWLAELHSLSPGAPQHSSATRKAAIRACKSLLHHDSDFFFVWMKRAEKFIARQKSVETRRFTRLVRRYDRVIARLAALPTTFIHGEFYPSNAIVRPASSKQKICVIDWEVAGIGPGALDLAALAAGEWSDSEKQRFAKAYREGLNSSRAPSVAELFEAMKLCQLHLSVQMLGWAEEWSPPTRHARNWLREALRLAEKLDL